MRFGTFCTGIGAPEVAFHRLGWESVFFSEIAKFPNAVLKTHWPNVPNIGDMNHAHNNPIFQNESIDLICAGTPCQSFSIAGLREGMASPNGNLALQFLRLCDRKRPRWVVWENVPGVFSSWSDAPDGSKVDGSGYGRETVEQTNDFDTFIGGLAEIGYGVAWRVLDAQNFGVPQRRERVFVVGYYGDWRRAAAVLFESDSLQRHPTKGETPRQRVTGTLTSRTNGGGGLGTDFDLAGGLQPAQISGTVSAKWQKGTGGPSGDEVQNLVTCKPLTTNRHQIGNDENLIVAATLSTQKKGGVGNESENLIVTPPLTRQSGTRSNNGEDLVVFNLRGREHGNQAEVQKDGLVSLRASQGGSSKSYIAFKVRGGKGKGGKGFLESEKSFALTATDKHYVFDIRNGLESNEITHPILSGHPGHGPSPNTVPHLATPKGVRLLMPIECERLQGLPDGHTAIIYRGKPAKDGPRYEAIGNSMCVDVLEWVARRIDYVDKI